MSRQTSSGSGGYVSSHTNDLAYSNEEEAGKPGINMSNDFKTRIPTNPCSASKWNANWLKESWRKTLSILMPMTKPGLNSPQERDLHWEAIVQWHGPTEGGTIWNEGEIPKPLRTEEEEIRSSMDRSLNMRKEYMAPALADWYPTYISPSSGRGMSDEGSRSSSLSWPHPLPDFPPQNWRIRQQGYPWKEKSKLFAGVKGGTEAGPSNSDAATEAAEAQAQRDEKKAEYDKMIWNVTVNKEEATKVL
ncbi:hypothetical protein IW262DRAFT_1454386 [Armillaria fumosa]|nr:hypothetical protein IW262DRAFT_1454386 [Armillaria fumosa]